MCYLIVFFLFKVEKTESLHEEVDKTDDKSENIHSNDGSIENGDFQKKENEDSIKCDLKDEFVTSTAKSLLVSGENNQDSQANTHKDSQANGKSDASVKSVMERNIEINNSKTGQENENGDSHEIDTGTLSDSDYELSMYLSAENANKRDKSEIKSLEVVTSDKSTIENGVGNMKTIEVQKSLGHINEERNNVDHEKADHARAGNDIGNLNENVSDNTLIDTVKNRALNCTEILKTGTTFDEITRNNQVTDIEEQNNNDIMLVNDVNSVIEHSDESDDELSMYLTSSETKKVCIEKENRNTDVSLPDQKTESQKTDLIVSCISTNHLELKSTSEETDCNVNIAEVNESKDSLQLIAEESAALVWDIPVSTNSLNKLEATEPQKVDPETQFMSETIKIADSSLHLKASNTNVEKPSPIKQKDVKTLEKMFHYSAEGFSDQIIIQSPTKIVSEPHSSDSEPSKGSSLVEITIINADETGSHEDTRESVFAASSGVKNAMSHPAVVGFNSSFINYNIDSNGTIELGQKSVPSLFGENDLRQKSDFTAVTENFLHDIKKQRNEDQPGTKYSYILDEDKNTKPTSVSNAVVASAVNETLKKLKSFEPFNPSKPEGPKVAAGKFFRKNNKLYVVSNVNGEAVEKEFVLSQKKANVKMPKTTKVEPELKRKSETNVGELVHNSFDKDNNSQNNSTENTKESYGISVKETDRLQPTQAVKARVEGKFLEKSKYTGAKVSQIMKSKRKKDIGIQSGVRVNTVSDSLHNGIPAGSNKQGNLTSSIIDLTGDPMGVRFKNETIISEKAPSGTFSKSSQSEVSVVSRNEGNTITYIIDKTEAVREKGNQETYDLSEDKFKDEIGKSVIMSSAASSQAVQREMHIGLNNEVQLSQAVTDDTKHVKEVHQETIIQAVGKDNAESKSEKDSDNKEGSKDFKDTATIRVFRVEQSPCKSGKRMAKFIILQDDGRYHEVDNVEIDVDTALGDTSVTSVPLKGDTKSTVPKSSARSREGETRIKGQSTETQLDSKVKDSKSSSVDAAVQSEICCCTCNCKCKAGTSFSIAIERQAVQRNQTEETTEDSEALAKVKRKLRMNEEVTNLMVGGSAEINDIIGVKAEQIVFTNERERIKLDMGENVHSKRVKQSKKSVEVLENCKITDKEEQNTLKDHSSTTDNKFLQIKHEPISQTSDSEERVSSSLVGTFNRDTARISPKTESRATKSFDETLKLIDISVQTLNKEAVLKLRKQVELMRLIGKNKKKAGCISVLQKPVRKRIHTAEVSKAGEKLNKQAYISLKMIDCDIGSGSRTKLEQTRMYSEIKKKDSENSNSLDVPKKVVKRKASENLRLQRENSESLTDDKEKDSFKLKTEPTAYVPKRARLKAEFSTDGGRELKKLKIDMKQEIIAQPDELNDIPIHSRLTRQKVKSPEKNVAMKENVIDSLEKIKNRSPGKSGVIKIKPCSGKSQQIKIKEKKLDPVPEKNKNILKKSSGKRLKVSPGNDSLNKTESEKGRKQESKKPKNTCKRELDNLFIDMVVGNISLDSSPNLKMTDSVTETRHTARAQSDAHSSDTQIKTMLKQKPLKKDNGEARTQKSKTKKPESKLVKTAKRSLGESFSPIKKGRVRICDDFIPDISLAMEECIRLIKEKEKVLVEDGIIKEEREHKIKKETVEKHDLVICETETEIRVTNETGTTSVSKEKDKVSGGFEIERQLCEICGKFVTVYYTKTGLLCYVSEKQLVNIDDNEQQLCEACGSIDDNGSVKAHYVLQEKNLTIDESHKSKDVDKQLQADNKIDCSIRSKGSPKGKSRKTKQKQEKSVKQLKVRFTEPKRSPKKDKDPKKRQIKDSSENTSEVKRKRVTKKSRKVTEIKAEKHGDVKTESDIEISSSLIHTSEKSESSCQFGLKTETDRRTEKVELHETDMKLEPENTEICIEKIESPRDSKKIKTDTCNKCKNTEGMKKRGAGKLKRSKVLKHSKKACSRRTLWHSPKRKYHRQFKKFQRYGWKKFLSEEAFDFHDIVKEEKKPDVKHVEKLIHKVLSKPKDPEHKKKKKHRSERKVDIEKMNMPQILTSPLERPRHFERFEFSPTLSGQFSSSETDTDVEGPFLSILQSNIAHPVSDKGVEDSSLSVIQANFADFVSDADSSVMKEYVAVKVDNSIVYENEREHIVDTVK